MDLYLTIAKLNSFAEFDDKIIRHANICGAISRCNCCNRRYSIIDRINGVFGNIIKPEVLNFGNQISAISTAGIEYPVSIVYLIVNDAVMAEVTTENSSIIAVATIDTVIASATGYNIVAAKSRNGIVPCISIDRIGFNSW